MSYKTRLQKAFHTAPVLPLSAYTHYVIFSDCHRGNGSANDNFRQNELLYSTALRHYYQQNYTYIELGDGDELWENRDLSQIMDAYPDIFRLMSLFYQDGRLQLLYGNHDIEKKKAGYSDAIFTSCYCHDLQHYEPLFPGLIFQEGLILEDPSTCKKLYLTHGHQTSLLNSTFWPLARFLVRHLWKPAEQIGIPDPTSAAKNYTLKEKTEEKLTNYARKENITLICGHTHRPMLQAENRHYINSGSCVHPGGVICLEISGNHISLVKWFPDTRKDRSLYVAREVLSSVTF